MDSIKKDQEANEEQDKGDNEEHRDKGHRHRDIPFLKVVEAVLSATCDISRAPVQPGIIRLEPLFDDDSDGRRRKAEHEACEPQSVQPYCIDWCYK